MGAQVGLWCQLCRRARTAAFSVAVGARARQAALLGPLWTRRRSDIASWPSLAPRKSELGIARNARSRLKDEQVARWRASRLQTSSRKPSLEWAVDAMLAQLVLPNNFEDVGALVQTCLLVFLAEPTKSTSLHLRPLALSLRN